MIRKEGKARWVFTCQPCNERIEAVDQFRAIEAMNRHKRYTQHAWVVLGQAFQGIVDALNQVVTPLLDALAPVLTPPPNKPHDPTLVKDRRKWGGR
ncbi:hypothetical protein [Paenarthrobacter nitroguajacolicus]|uniref:hypothetical protein n=1 Tax=Paenarthrobacter nitroguajacolicus TaxID=211146 RepID=UPI0015B7E15E|nr:hypothetical protein [Paenarthrobacter nitroguajacolicus]NWL34448.1 hypothetical protein [Paenarthrobacter nitroguajacolicus]